MPDPACPFCGSETELASDSRDMPGTNGERQTPAHRWWLECRNLDCRACGPRMKSPEAASLAFLQIQAAAAHFQSPTRERIFADFPPRIAIAPLALPLPRPPFLRPPILFRYESARPCPAE